MDLECKMCVTLYLRFYRTFTRNMVNVSDRYIKSKIRLNIGFEIEVGDEYVLKYIKNLD